MATDPEEPTPEALAAAAGYARSISDGYEAAAAALAAALVAFAELAQRVDEKRDPLGSTVRGICDQAASFGRRVEEGRGSLAAYGGPDGGPVASAYADLLAKSGAGQLSRAAEEALRRALRDIADGHLTVWRSRDTGEDLPDRQVALAPVGWWEILRLRGLYEPPEVNGHWRLVSTSGPRSRSRQVSQPPDPAYGRPLDGLPISISGHGEGYVGADLALWFSTRASHAFDDEIERLAKVLVGVAGVERAERSDRETIALHGGAIHRPLLEAAVREFWASVVEAAALTAAEGS